MIAITLRFFSEVDEEQNTAHDVLLPSSGVLMISGVIVAGIVVKAESNDKNQFFSSGRDKFKYTLVGRYWFREICNFFL
jgi:hypothetical protein